MCSAAATLFFCSLQVAREQEVLDALALWVKARLDERCSLFADMFGEFPL